MVAAETRLGRRWGLRLDGEWSFLRGQAGQNAAEIRDLRAAGASLNGLLWLSNGPLAPYALVGIGAYRLQRVDDVESPYGTTGAVQAGLGLDADLGGRIDLFMETRAVVHATDYGSRELSPTIYWPVVIGVRVE